MTSLTSLLAIAVGVGGCGVLIVALVLVAWALAQNRRPPST
jgi:hypothetical protein